jgi:transketolase
MEYVAVDDSFGESGKPEELMKKYGLDADHIVKAVHVVLERKSGNTHR